MSLVPAGARENAWAGGSGAPEKPELRVGFIPLTDCASVVAAAHEGFDLRHGIRIVPVKKPSWAAMRDGLLSGELDAAHVLYGLVYGVQMGVGGLQRDMAVLMTINRNGQSITLSNRFRSQGVADGATLRARIGRDSRRYALAQTFPTGTHAMWLYYWLAAHGVDPLRDVETVVVRPPQMVSEMRAGNIEGCCVGEPWGAQAVHDGVGFTAATSQDVWPDHPEKVLGATADFVARHPNACRALVAAMLEASRFVDAAANRSAVARLIAQPAYVDTEVSVIEQRFLGSYHDGLGREWTDAHCMRFFADGEATFPYLSDGMWFLTQQRRWGMLKREPDYLAVAKQVNRIELYAQAAAQVGVALPASALRVSRLIDGAVWDGADPARYAASFAVRAA
ncbi:MAG TPA: CmpA/NrtA family ABC transporter substrate-binding protein [Burkholderiales bacterium]|nr:CmpA/NrtA family ABC transporter substrate-binding protein [Burkholderiales bacterium]